MFIFRTTAIILMLLLAACANHEGLYEPACIAYEGDRIELRAGRFEWQRFTDQRSVNGDGNIIEPFPNFPKTGKYTLAAGKMTLVTNDGVRLNDWYLVEHVGQYYLLTSEQHDAYRGTEVLPDCALKLTEPTLK